MKSIGSLLNIRQQDLAQHPFFVQQNWDDAAIDERLAISSLMMNFLIDIINSRKWIFGYEAPSTEWEERINSYLAQSSTQPQLMYRFFSESHFDHTINSTASRTLWLHFLGNETESIRHFEAELVNLVVNQQDPIVRVPIIDAIQMCVDVFLARTQFLSNRPKRASAGSIIEQGGQSDGEQKTCCGYIGYASFIQADLTSDQHMIVERAVNFVVDHFLKVLDQLLFLATRYSNHDESRFFELEREFRRQQRIDPLSCILHTQSHSQKSLKISATQFELLDYLAERQTLLRHHDSLSWLKVDRSMSAADKLRGFVAIWAVDILGYRDFNEMVLRYTHPKNEMELAINQWTQKLATHAPLYLRDWEALSMDKITSWGASETMAFYHFSSEMETHRASRAKIKKYAFNNEDPLLRWWLMYALEQACVPLFDCTEIIARRAEVAEGIRLDYWAHRHHLVESTCCPNIKIFLNETMTKNQIEKTKAIINTIFNEMEQQFDYSYRLCRTKVFLNKPLSLIPKTILYSQKRSSLPSDPLIQSTELNLS